MNTRNLQLAYSGSDRIQRMPFSPPQRVTLSDSVGEWQAVVKDRLEELIRLEPGWDGYTGNPVTFENAMFAFRMLESICRPSTPAPQIVPGSSGDLQIEWHTQRGDIELWVQGPNRVQALCEINNGQISGEMDLTTDFSTVSGWVKAATEPTIAIAAAA